MEHNDAAQTGRKVGAADAIEMLRSLGWKGNSRTSLDSVCAAHLGRRTYGTP